MVAFLVFVYIIWQIYSHKKIFNLRCIVYSLDGKSGGRGSMSSDAKGIPESDTDSMAEYGEGDTGKKLGYDIFAQVLFSFQNL